jgi:hypothetical protein
VYEPTGEDPPHFYCADTLIEHYKARDYKVLIVLVTTGEQLQINGRKHFESLLFPAGKPSAPEVVSERSGQYSREETVARDQRAMAESARDFYIMSLTDIQILSINSGFGVVGSMAGLRPKHIMYHLGDTGNRDCAATPEGDDLSVFANEWSCL